MTPNLTTAPPETPLLPRAMLVPVLAPLIRRRFVSLSLAAAGTLQVVATLFHWPAMRCPVMELFHIPCPGCGASRACAAVLHGNWPLAVQLHAFAPMLLGAIALFWVTGLLPNTPRERLSGGIEQLERRTALPSLLLVALFLYWIVRLLYAPTAFVHLVST